MIPTDAAEIEFLCLNLLARLPPAGHARLLRLIEAEAALLGVRPAPVVHPPGQSRADRRRKGGGR